MRPGTRVPAVALLVLLCCVSADASGQLTGAVGPRASDGPDARRAATDLDTRRELWLLGIGVGLQGAFRLVPRPTRTVPTSGLDPGRIVWSLDRGVVGTRNLAADVASGRASDGALAFLVLMAVTTAGRDDTLSELARRGVVYAEAALVSHGLTYLAKRALARPRPFAYLPSGERPSGSAYDVSKSGAFESLPSGHGSSAWTAATLAMTEHLLSRPRAGSLERVAVGFLGGGLAGTTAALRVAAGQHFPSDVMVSAGIGLFTGIGIPLLHRGGRALPTRRAWLETATGAALGVLAGILVAGVY